MKKKKPILIAFGWTTCTAAAFWAGLRWSPNGVAAGSGKPGRAGIFEGESTGAAGGAAIFEYDAKT